MSKLLLNEKPIVLLPSLVKAFGFCEAAFLQKLHYFLEANAEKKRNFIAGRFWSHGTYAEWAETLDGIFAESTIRKAVSALEKKGLLVSTTEYNQHPFDRTKWYSIDYEVFAAFERGESPDKDEQDDPIADSGTIRYEIADESATRERMNALPDSTSYKELNVQLSGQLNGQLSGRFSARDAHATHDTPPDAFAENDSFGAIEQSPSPSLPIRERASSADAGEVASEGNVPRRNDSHSGSAKRFNPLAALLAEGVERQVAEDWLAVRKAKLTQTALDGVIREAGKAGISVGEAVRIAAERGWRGFKADWDWRSGGAPRGRVFDHATGEVAGVPAQDKAQAMIERLRAKGVI